MGSPPELSVPTIGPLLSLPLSLFFFLIRMNSSKPSFVCLFVIFWGLNLGSFWLIDWYFFFWDREPLPSSPLLLNFSSRYEGKKKSKTFSFLATLSCAWLNFALYDVYICGRKLNPFIGLLIVDDYGESRVEIDFFSFF